MTAFFFIKNLMISFFIFCNFNIFVTATDHFSTKKATSNARFVKEDLSTASSTLQMDEMDHTFSVHGTNFKVGVKLEQDDDSVKKITKIRIEDASEGEGVVWAQSNNPIDVAKLPGVDYGIEDEEGLQDELETILRVPATAQALKEIITSSAQATQSPVQKPKPLQEISNVQSLAKSSKPPPVHDKEVVFTVMDANMGANNRQAFEVTRLHRTTFTQKDIHDLKRFLREESSLSTAHDVHLEGAAGDTKLMFLFQDPKDAFLVLTALNIKISNILGQRQGLSTEEKKNLVLNFPPIKVGAIFETSLGSAPPATFEIAYTADSSFRTIKKITITKNPRAALTLEEKAKIEQWQSNGPIEIEFFPHITLEDAYNQHMFEKYLERMLRNPKDAKLIRNLIKGSADYWTARQTEMATS